MYLDLQHLYLYILCIEKEENLEKLVNEIVQSCPVLADRFDLKVYIRIQIKKFRIHPTDLIATSKCDILCCVHLFALQPELVEVFERPGGIHPTIHADKGTAPGRDQVDGGDLK